MRGIGLSGAVAALAMVVSCNEPVDEPADDAPTIEPEAGLPLALPLAGDDRMSAAALTVTAIERSTPR